MIWFNIIALVVSVIACLVTLYFWGMTMYAEAWYRKANREAREARGKE